jgi:hypothetical protein
MTLKTVLLGVSRFPYVLNDKLLEEISNLWNSKNDSDQEDHQGSPLANGLRTRRDGTT